MSQTIKVSGIPDEMARKLEERWRAEHYADRSEYVRELLRRDLKAASLGEFARQTFGNLSGDPTGDPDEETLAEEIAEAIREVRASRRSRPAA